MFKILVRAPMHGCGDGRSQAGAVLCARAPHSRAEPPRRTRPRPRVVAALETVAATYAVSSRSNSKPAAGSAIAAVSERRRPSPARASTPTRVSTPPESRNHATAPRPKSSVRRASTPSPQEPEAPPRIPRHSSPRPASPVIQTIASPQAACVTANEAPLKAIVDSIVQPVLKLNNLAESDVADVRQALVEKRFVMDESKSPASLNRNARPVATPCSPAFRTDTRSPGASAPTCPVAAAWLRLARIALLEFPHHRPPWVRNPIIWDDKKSAAERINQGSTPQAAEAMPWKDKAFPDDLLIPDGDTFDDAGDNIEAHPRSEQATLAWARIISRVMGVISVNVEPPSSPCGSPPRRGHEHICLGDMMEESISWIDPDSEDDRCSPKQADLLMAAQAYHDACEEEEDKPPRGFEAIARQQNAPGIVAGMPKCLSF